MLKASFLYKYFYFIYYEGTWNLMIFEGMKIPFCAVSAWLHTYMNIVWQEKKKEIKEIQL